MAKSVFTVKSISYISLSFKKTSFWRVGISVLFYFLIYFILLFIFGRIGSLLLRAGFFSSCGERGLLFIVVRRLLIAVASLVVKHGL